MKPLRRNFEGKSPTRLLWVGNSYFYYNNSIHSHVREFARARDPDSDHQATSVTISGSGLDWHDMQSYFRGGIGRYAYAANNEIVFKPPGRGFDAVIMMDSSQGPIHPQLGHAFHGTAQRQSR